MDDAGLPGWGTYLALDGDGNAHIAYSEVGGMDLVYATNESGAWVTDVVDVDGVSDVWIAVDADGAPFILYSYWFDWADHGLRLASKTGADWDIEHVATGDIYRPRLLVDPDGYVQACAGGTHYTNESGAWVATAIPRPAGDCAIARDADGALHVITGGDGGVHYSTDTSGAWVTVDVTAVDSLAPQIGLDAAGDVHAAWGNWNLGDPDLWYATNMDGAWSADALDTDGAEGYGASLAVDPEGTAHVLHADFTDGEIRHGVVTPQNGVDDDCDGVAW